MNLHEAACELGIKLPILVQVVPDHRSLGTYCGVRDGQHRIIVRQRGDDNPTNTLWHELTHALQCERDYDCDSHRMAVEHAAEFARLLGRKRISPRTAQVLIRRELDASGISPTLAAYNSMTWEWEANEVAARNDYLPITFTETRWLKEES